MEDLVSVIVPMYNSEKTIRDTIKSIQQQTYSKLDIILVDDGSKDNTSIICKKIANEDPRIRYIYQENQGEGGARNKGLLLVRGKYVVFVDSDDKLPEDGIELLYAHYDYPLVIGGIGKTEYGIRREHVPQEEVLVNKQEIADFISDQQKMYYINTAWAKMYHADILLKNEVCFNDFKFGEDTFFVYQYLNYIDRIYVVGSIVYDVVAIENSMSLRKVEKSWEIMKTLYEKGKQLLDPQDNINKYYLLDRSIKQTLILESRFPFRNFKLTCRNISKYAIEQNIVIPKYKATFYQRVVFKNVEYGNSLLLYLFFKIRRLICIMLKK